MFIAYWETSRVTRAYNPTLKKLPLPPSSVNWTLSLHVVLVGESIPDDACSIVSIQDVIVDDILTIQPVIQCFIVSNLDLLSFDSMPGIPTPRFTFVVFSDSESTRWTVAGDKSIAWSRSSVSRSNLVSILRPIFDLIPHIAISAPASIDLDSDYHLSFHLANAGPSPEDPLYTWEFSLVQQYMSRFISKLRVSAYFGIGEQVVPFSRFEDRIQNDTNGYFINQRDLSLFRNDVSWSMNTGASAHVRPIELLIYIPHSFQQPLRIAGNPSHKVQGFLIPDWGGVVIWNYNNRSELSEVVCIPTEDFEKPISSVLAILRSMFGLQELSKLSAHPDIVFEQPVGGIYDWEPESIQRRFTWDFQTRALTNLRSYSTLLDEFPQIPTNEELSNLTQSAYESLYLSKSFFSSGDLSSSQNHARRAFKLSHELFFNPSLLPALYFPEDQTLAVYLPLVLPIVMPLVRLAKAKFQMYRSKLKTE